jgi:hypothetical protein
MRIWTKKFCAVWNTKKISMDVSQIAATFQMPEDEIKNVLGKNGIGL